MNTGQKAQSIGKEILLDIEKDLGKISPQLRKRAQAVAEMAAQLFINELAGESMDEDRQIVKARTQALKAAGATAIAAAITSGLQNLALKSLKLLAAL